MSDKVDREAVQRLISDCEEAHALYAAHGVDGAEGARMMSEAARGLADLLAENARLHLKIGMLEVEKKGAVWVCPECDIPGCKHYRQMMRGVMSDE